MESHVYATTVHLLFACVFDVFGGGEGGLIQAA